MTKKTQTIYKCFMVHNDLFSNAPHPNSNREGGNTLLCQYIHFYIFKYDGIRKFRINIYKRIN